MPSGDFTQEAYQQLRAAYADSLSTQEDQELEGKEIFGRKMTLETLPVNSPWRGRIKDWQYPDGKTEYQDGKQSPDEILQLMRDSVMEKKTADAEAEELSDEELDAILDQILEEGDDEADDDESEEDEDDDEEEELTEEELDAILDDVGDGDEEGDEEEDEDEDGEEFDEEEEEVDPEVVASQIAELKEQIESFRFNNISDVDIEE
jgi:hypothetical protein